MTGPRRHVVTRLRTPLLLVWLTALWLLLWADLSFANVVSGIVVAAVLLAAAGTRPIRRTGGSVGDGDGESDIPVLAPLATLRFTVWVLAKLVQANLSLAWEILTPTNKISTGVVAVPLRTRSPLASMAVANVITLTPGTLSIELDGMPPVLYVHVLHLHDPDQVRADLLRVEELAVRAFGSARARAQLSEGLAS